MGGDLEKTDFDFDQKCVGKEEFEFPGLSGQISNFLTFFKMCAKICQAVTKQEK